MHLLPAYHSSCQMTSVVSDLSLVRRKGLDESGCPLKLENKWSKCGHLPADFECWLSVKDEFAYKMNLSFG